MTVLRQLKLRTSTNNAVVMLTFAVLLTQRLREIWLALCETVAGAFFQRNNLLDPSRSEINWVPTELNYFGHRKYSIIVKCDNIMIFPPSQGVLGKDAENTFKKEVKFRHLDNMGMCRVGMEIHFKASQTCNGDQTVTRRRKKRLFDCWWCKGGCYVVESAKWSVTTRQS